MENYIQTHQSIVSLHEKAKELQRRVLADREFSKEFNRLEWEIRISLKSTFSESSWQVKDYNALGGFRVLTGDETDEENARMDRERLDMIVCFLENLCRSTAI